MKGARPGTPRRTRAGIAMATALGGLVIIGVMIAGVFFTSNQELRVGTNTFVQERAFRAAEFGLNAALANWNNPEMLLLGIGSSKQIVYDSSARGWRDTVSITRLTVTTYLIGSTGTAFGGIQGTSRRRTALLVRVSVPTLDVKAALVSRGETSLAQVPLTGFDTNPLGWTSCPAAQDSVAGAAVADSGDMGFKNSCPLSACLLGTPKLLVTPAASDTSTYTVFDDETYATLTSYSPKTFTSASNPPARMEPAVTGGACDKTATKNWGDPSRSSPAAACESYFPIIHLKGSSYSAQLKGGTGQGILLVDGNLEISGDFTFYGPVIVKGNFESKGSAKVHGTVMAANTSGGNNNVTSLSTVTYSSCAIKKAFENAIPPKRVVQRAWMEVF